ncbi:lysylphosphatidylglycerol synthase transmembrane domain-containing protein [Desulfococcaceae bacterium HSG9]|nr:lysylphosphatidylglycerol synthase transmembrane domain-containing protein [Desulfococcaceae bacterium HSG9]
MNLNIDRKIWLTIVQTLISLTFLILIFHRFDWTGFFHLIKKIPVWFFIYSLILTIAYQFLYVLKWNIILRTMEIRIAYKNLAKYTFVGFFFANFAPSSIGQDATKVYYLGKKEGYLNIGASVIIDRFLGLFAMTFLATILIWNIDFTAPVFEIARTVLTLLCLGFIIAFIVGHFKYDELLNRIFKQFKNPNTKSKMETLNETMQQFLFYIRIAGSNLKVLFSSIFIFIIIFLITAIVYIHFFEITTGKEFSLWRVMAVTLIIVIITNLPISLNGIGVREQSHYIFLAALGIPKEAAVSISLLIFSHAMVLSLIGLVLWLRREKRQFPVDEKTPHLSEQILP